MKTIQEIINEGSSNMKLWDTIDACREALGDEEFINALCQAMSDDELEENLKFICRNYEIPFKK